MFTPIPTNNPRKKEKDFPNFTPENEWNFVWTTEKIKVKRVQLIKITGVLSDNKYEEINS